MSFRKNQEAQISIQWKIINLLIKDEECRFKIDRLKAQYFIGDANKVFSIIEDKFIHGKNIDWDIIVDESNISIPDIEISPHLFDDLVRSIIDSYDRSHIQNSLQGIDFTEPIETIRGKIFTLANDISSEEIPEVNVKDILENILSGERINKSGLIYTGVEKLDEKLGGLMPGELVLLGARPSMGKSGFAQQIMMQNSYHNNNTTLYFTLEDSRENTIIRSLGHLSGVPYQKIIRQVLDEGDKINLNLISDKFIKSNFYIDDNTRSITKIIATSRKFKAKNPKCNLIIIDYVQLISGRNDDKYEDVSFASSALSALAKDLHVVILLVSQLSRSCESRDDKRPINSDLRESGYLEQDAHRIIFLYRNYYYSKDEAEKNICEYLLSKNKHGEIGNIIGNAHLACLQFR